MKKILVLILILTITSNLFSQIDSTKVAFVSYWSIGDSYDFKVSKTTQNWREGKLTQDEKQEYLANFRVIDSTENSYTIKWSFENDLINKYDIPEKHLPKFSKYKTTELVYKTSELGDFTEILNWKEVGETMNNMFDDIAEVLVEEDDAESKKDDLIPLIQTFKQIYSTKQGIENIVMKEIQCIHFPMGVEFDITQPIFYDDELPNMFGGEPIKANVKLYFENVEFDESFCTFKQEMSLDPNDTREMLRDVFKKTNPDDERVKDALISFVFEINDRNSYEYYFNPGVPHKIEVKRETLIDIDNSKVKKINETIIELIYD